MMLEFTRDVPSDARLRPVAQEPGAQACDALLLPDPELYAQNERFMSPEVVRVFFVRGMEAEGSRWAEAGSTPAVLGVCTCDDERDERMPVRMLLQASARRVAVLRDQEWTDPANALRVTEEPRLRRRSGLARCHGDER
jgi:hypothetical protein